MDGVDVFFLGIFVAIFLVLSIFFSISLYRALKRVPAAQLLFPAWFVWMFFVPLAGYVFVWLMLPFGVPKSFAQAVPDNLNAQKRTRTLFGLGLTHCILLIITLIPYAALVFFLPMLVIWIIYWVKVIAFRKLYLDALAQNQKAS